MANRRTQGQQRNKLLRYRAILETYLQHKTDDIPFAVVWRKYVYPVHFISIGTLRNIIDTPINKQLKEIDNQTSLFD
ncbi:hypothetical protein [Flavobacterium psychrophilum]|uniref:hypothetical protein n=1 Tax=Flavobacterium psychrophilum TaxID=96345 RepID=UPI000B7C35B6|nr:hypothetical protein [Flavobacterium psychrophilum]MCB6089146.1 hypothetical protein [Flavobacterium psychrophilum]MCB6231845.1 hypothetical protein [Flavobacterium psychrophilum]MEB3380321.1 hypothetical protein [Flavobacterium psychrophilum]SNA72014.1 conserved hypothetical protein [Flavobacterium psychrophilum]SNA77760.1 conserved hypothetical protein [Flavobacterium psychrophilum]